MSMKSLIVLLVMNSSSSIADPLSYNSDLDSKSGVCLQMSCFSFRVKPEPESIPTVKDATALMQEMVKEMNSPHVGDPAAGALGVGGVANTMSSPGGTNRHDDPSRIGLPPSPVGPFMAEGGVIAAGPGGGFLPGGIGGGNIGQSPMERSVGH